MEQLKSKEMGLLSKFSLEDKVAIVTGSGYGIGRGIALAFANVGAHVTVVSRTLSDLEKVADEMKSLGRRSLPVVADVTNSEQVKSMVDKVLVEFGRIDILVNNVGGGRGGTVPPLEMPEEVWDRVINQNLKSTFLCTKAVGKVMVDQKRGGSIINISSVRGVLGDPASVAYGTAKAGVINFTTSMSTYLAPYYIRVNCITPGRIHTAGTLASLGSDEERVRERGIPLNRIGQPEDIGLTAVYLASDAADWITGVNIEVTGGEYFGRFKLEAAERVWAKAKSQQ